MISKRIYPSALVLLACICFPAQCIEELTIVTSYRKNLEIISTMLKQDFTWRYVFNQSVYYNFDKHLHKNVIETYLLKDAVEPTAVKPNTTTEHHAGEDTSHDMAKSEKPVGNPVKPKVILSNLLDDWYRIDTLVTMTLQILQTSFKCLAYKHFSILLTLIRVEISRKHSQKRATNWSRKAKDIVLDIIMQMAALQFTDSVFQRMFKFFTMYDKPSVQTINQKYNYTPYLDELITVMMTFISQNCYRFKHSDSDIRVSGMKGIAQELKVRLVESLFNAYESKQIDEKTFSSMFNNSMDRIKEHFSGLPLNIGMSKLQWTNLVHIYEENEYVNEDPDYLRM